MNNIILLLTINIASNYEACPVTPVWIEKELSISSSPVSHRLSTLHPVPQTYRPQHGHGQEGRLVYVRVRLQVVEEEELLALRPVRHVELIQGFVGHTRHLPNHSTEGVQT